MDDRAVRGHGDGVRDVGGAAGPFGNEARAYRRRPTTQAVAAQDARVHAPRTA